MAIDVAAAGAAYGDVESHRMAALATKFGKLLGWTASQAAKQPSKRLDEEGTRLTLECDEDGPLP